jgi:hypothetical protein
MQDWNGNAGQRQVTRRFIIWKIDVLGRIFAFYVCSFPANTGVIVATRRINELNHMVKVGLDEHTRTPSGQVEQRTIEHVPVDERHGRARDLFTVWFGSNIMLLTIITGALATTVSASRCGPGRWRSFSAT